MANLVTNMITLSGDDQTLERVISRLTDADPGPLLAGVRSNPGVPVWVRAEPWRGVPEPEVIAVTKDGVLVDLGLAALSRDGVDHLRLKQDRDPFLSQMPPEFGETADSLLRKMGVQELRGEALHAAVEAKAPGSIGAGRSAILAYEATGEFGWYDWRMLNWGARAFGEELRVEGGADGSVSVRFDSVNSCPVPLICALLGVGPDLQLSGAAIEEDTGFSLFLVSDGTELLISEGEGEEDLGRAYRIVYGRDPDEEEPEVDDEDPQP
jgi:hypothetical protein